jgi:hypothetical protein
MGNQKSRLSTPDEIYYIRNEKYYKNLSKALHCIDATFKEGSTNWFYFYDSRDYFIPIEYHEKFHQDVKNNLESRGFKNVIVRKNIDNVKQFQVKCDVDAPLPKYSK